MKQSHAFEKKCKTENCSMDRTAQKFTSNAWLFYICIIFKEFSFETLIGFFEIKDMLSVKP